MGQRAEERVATRELRPGDVLTGALADARTALSSPAARALVDELLDLGPGADLTGWLIAPAAADAEQRQVLGDVLGSVARRLAHTGDAPADGAAAEAWHALAVALDRLYGSGVRALGRLPFISDALLSLLLTEARQQLPEHDVASRPAPGPPGRVLASLAVSPKLREVVAVAFGFPVAPTYDAVYLYDPPGSHVRTHVDTRDYELVFHLILEHTLPEDGSPGSALVVHLPGEPEPTRVPLQPGEAVALRGRGTIHSWEPLRDDEHRIVIAVGFVSSA